MKYLFYLLTFIFSFKLAASTNQCVHLFQFSQNKVNSTETLNIDNELNLIWLKEAKKDLSNNWNLLKDAIKNKDPQIIFLESLGFKFRKKNPTIPNIDSLFFEITKKVDQLVLNGLIKSSEAIYPARIFSKSINGVKEYIPIKLGEIAPDGYLPDDLLLGVNFAKFVKAGFFPFGEPQYGAAESSSSLLFHDLAHFGSMIEKPEFMKTIRLTYSHIADHPEYFNNPDFDVRLNQILESTVAIYPKYRNEITIVLESLGLGLDQLNTNILDLYNNLLQKRSNDELETIINKITKFMPHWIDNFGGLQRDITARTNARNWNYQQYTYLGNNIRSQFESLIDNQFNRQMKIETLAKYLTSLYYMKQINPEDWLLATFKNEKFKENTILHDYICKSGAIIVDNQMKLFCF